jgi:hypothetical protein
MMPTTGPGCEIVVTPDWVLHLLKDGLSETAGSEITVLPLEKLQFSRLLGGPVVGNPYRWRFFLAAIPSPEAPQPMEAEVKARLLWMPVKAEEKGPIELASWSITGIPPRKPEGWEDVIPMEGVVEGLDLLGAWPGDKLILELEAPLDASGKPTVELAVGGKENDVGDSFIGLAIGPPVVLKLEPMKWSMSPGEEKQFKAAVFVEEREVPGAVVSWSVRPPDGPATISPEGVLKATGEGMVNVVARYQGMEAVAEVSIAPKPPVGISGDVDRDGVVSVRDAILVLRAAVGLVELDPSVLPLADANGDGRVSIGDVVIILRRVVGLA